MNFLKTLLFSSLIGLVIFIASCNKEEIVVNEAVVSNVVDHSDQVFVAQLQQVADVLSISIQNDKTLQAELKKFALESEEGGHQDVEFFYHLVKDIELESGKSLKQLLLDNGLSAKQETELCKLPGLAFLLIGTNHSAFSNKIYLDDGFDDSDPNATIPYYKDGIADKQSITEDPEGNTFVVRISEVYAAPGTHAYELHKNLPDAIKEIGKTECGEPITVIGRMTADTEFDLSNNTVSSRSCGCTQTYDRDCESLTDNLKMFKTSNDHDGGFRGKGEFFWLIVAGDNIAYSIVNGAVQVTGNSLDYINTGIFGSVEKDTWYSPNYSSYIWSLNNDGDRMKYVAYESDGGNTTTINVALGLEFKPISWLPKATVNTSIPITINNGDDFIGETIADYHHDILRIQSPFSICWGFLYNYGSVQMYLNER